jgi:hypothetical protein
MATVADDGGDSAAFLGTDDWTTNDTEGKAFDVATTQCVMARMTTVNFIIVTRLALLFNVNGRQARHHRHFFVCVLRVLISTLYQFLRRKCTVAK